MDADPVLTPADLKHWSFPGTALAVLGHPIGHSLSPVMHNAALKALARSNPEFKTWRYFRFDVPPARLRSTLKALQKAGFQGVNLTVPHKILAVPMVAKVAAEAVPIGAVNTLKLHHDEAYYGFNTDGYGLSAALKAAFGFSVRGKPVILLGAGGAARGAAVECLERGCASLWIANRTRETLTELVRTLRRVAGKIPLHPFAPGEVPPGLPKGAVVINATSLGLSPADPSPIDLSAIPRPRAVFDMIYNPPETALLRQARALRIPRRNGLGMLVHQGAKALELWTGVKASRTAPSMSRALIRARSVHP